jgi:hypothetical protein
MRRFAQSFSGLLAFQAVFLLGPFERDASASGTPAEELARRMLEHDVFGFEGARVRARLILTDAAGATQERAFDALSKKQDGGLLESVVRFTAPSAVAGTAFLMIQHVGGEDEQYVYLSRMRTTRRIGAGGERGGSFMGSDFSYADLERKDLRDAAYALLDDDTIGRDDCRRLEATPRSPSAYARIVVWVRERDAMPLRVQWFGADGQPVKTMFTRRIGTVAGHEVVSESHAESARTHHATDLVIDDITFDAGIDDAEFTPAALAH